MDLRMFGRHFEELYKEAQLKHGIQFIRARLSEAFENPDGSLQIRIEDTLLGKPMKMQIDMMVLMVGIQQDRQKGNVLELAGIGNDTDNFMLQPDPYFSSSSTGVEGIFCAGGITGPKTIDETMVEARAAVADIERYLGVGALVVEPDNSMKNYD
jgi:heterodisulfide reductase subunit A